MKIIFNSFIATLVLIFCIAILYGIIHLAFWISPYLFYALVETDNVILKITAWFCFLWLGITFLMQIDKAEESMKNLEAKLGSKRGKNHEI